MRCCLSSITIIYILRAAKIDHFFDINKLFEEKMRKGVGNFLTFAILLLPFRNKKLT